MLTGHLAAVEKDGLRDGVERGPEDSHPLAVHEELRVEEEDVHGLDDGQRMRDQRREHVADGQSELEVVHLETCESRAPL